jgi:hypothetical protein
MTTSLEPDELRRWLDEAAAGPTAARFDDVFRRAHRQRRAWRTGLVMATIVVVAAAITVPTVLVSRSSTPQQVATSPPPAPSAHTDPLALVGRWKLAAAGEKPGTSLILGDGLSLFRPCGMLEGAWRADDGGLFVGGINSGDSSCFHSKQGAAAPWLASAVGYRSEGPDRVLINAAGQVVAVLSPGARPRTGPNDSTSDTAAPKLTASLKAALASPAALPPGLRPATLGAIGGRWIAGGPELGNAAGYVQFNQGGTWVGSDGCNGYGGRLAVGDDGEILTTSSGTTDVGCNVSPAPRWVENARRAGFDGSVLVLLDAQGKVLGRLVRESAVSVAGTFERVGGAFPGTPLALRGIITVHLDSLAGPVVARARATHGQFTLTLPVGRYVLAGVSPTVQGTGPCLALKPPLTVTVGAEPHVAVECQIL